MKKGIHPKLQRVAFKDVSTGDVFVTQSTIGSKESMEVDGAELPLIKIDISSKSHPFFTGKQKFVDAEGRVKKFEKKYGASMSAKEKK